MPTRRSPACAEPERGGTLRPGPLFAVRASRIPFALLSLLACAPALAAGAPPDLVLITLDTVRADELGVAGGAALTPNLDRLAAAGVRFARALSPAPLTLPAHASILTGLDPVEHALRDNGRNVLPAAAPTLAAELAQEGYATLAVVGSRVLDRRFGLDRGFDRYDDRMAAERVGEFGYAERPAREVVDAALAASAAVPPARPLFLWVHFYDAHAPYSGAGTSERERYRAEIAAVDLQVGRLLAALRPGRERWVIAVGDHGESFGEHGEEEHGYLLHEATLAVPLILSGPTARAGTLLRAPVSIRDLAATLAALGGRRRTALGGRALDLEREPAEVAIYHETEFPASTFGWGPLAAVTRGRWRLVEGPRPQLFDLAADPREEVNRIGERPSVVRALRRDLRGLRQRPPLAAPAVGHDAELARALESLGYLSGATARRGTLDPVEGVRLLPRFDAARQLLDAGDAAAAREALRALVRESPGSVPFLAQLARAERALGDFDAARSTLAAARAVQPESEFLATALAALELEAGRPAAAESAYRAAVAISPRHAAAWLGLGELLARGGRGDEEESALRAAVAAQCESATLHVRLTEIALARGDLAAAEVDGRRATELLPEWGAAWRAWAEVARRAGDERAHRERAERARALGG